MKIIMFNIVGDFGEDKDAAAKIRRNDIEPCVQRKETIILDFDDVSLVTQSFIHALISNILRVHGEGSLDYLDFKNCSEVVQGIISTVVQYSLDTAGNDEQEGY
jgi:hypothetical protein